MAKKSFEDSLEEQLLRFTQGPVKDLLAEARAPVEQIDRTDRPDRPVSQTDQTDQSVRPTGQTDRTDRMDSPGRQTDESDRPTGQIDRSVRSDRLTDQTNQTDRSDSPVTGLVKITPRSDMTTPGQKAVFRYFQVNGSHVTTYELISQETRIPRGTVRAVIKKMESLGYLSKRDWWSGNTRAISFTFKEIGQIDRTVRSDRSTGHTNQADRPPIMKIDRIENLSIQEDAFGWDDSFLMLMWPAVYEAGFRMEQVRQAVAAREKTGKQLELDMTSLSLDRADWELAEKGCLTDIGSGEKVRNAASYIFTALARWGVLRAHPEYVSRQEQEAKNAGEELKRRQEAEAALEDTRFQTWLAELTPEALEEAMRGFPGGSKDAWLKKQWREK